VHIVAYACEDCGTEQSSEVGLHSEGLCPVCGSPMRIDDLFSDRRIVTIPVTVDRRERAI
jgi:transcription initiation factor IIE alpha subunit